mgnify:CR=1 FL=1
MRLKYLVFGLRVESEIELPDCFALEFDQPQVTVLLSEVEGHRIVSQDHPVAFSVDGGTFLFERYGVARFAAVSGRSVQIDAYPDASWEEILTYLLGSVFAALLHQRGVLALHAGAGEVEGGAVLFAGQSGAGKSTLAAAFAAAGFGILADDVTAIHSQDEGLVAYPALRRLKLWESATRALGMDASNMQPMHSRAPGRYRLPLATSSLKPRALRGVLLIVPWANDEVVIQEAHGSRLFNLILRATYRAGLLAPLQAQASHFSVASAVTRAVPVGLLCRPSGAFNLAEMKAKILEFFGRC